MDSRLLTINEVTAASMAVIKEADQEDRALFQSWIGEALNSIGPNSSWSKNCDLFPKDGSLRKPKDLTATVDFALYDENGCELRYNFIPNSPGRIHVDRYEILDNFTPTGISGRVDLSEDAYYYHLGVNGDLVSMMKISYLAMPVDRDGMPLIPENNLTAYKMFCRWNWAMRQNDNQSFIDQTYTMWLRERDRVRGRNKMPDEARAKEMLRKYMSLISAKI